MNGSSALFLDGMPLFQDEFLYISFTSQLGCNISLKFAETESPAQKMREKLANYKKQQHKANAKMLDDYQEAEDPYHQEMLDSTLQR